MDMSGIASDGAVERFWRSKSVKEYLEKGKKEMQYKTKNKWYASKTLWIGILSMGVAALKAAKKDKSWQAPVLAALGAGTAVFGYQHSDDKNND